GMSQETLSRVFEPYYTTKASGTGLGLTMVYKIVKEFSGDIQVESREGEGSAFVISLPIPQTDKRLLEAK
ncbi:MAG: two-component sensor histidine kinase, partial [Treponema sp.]|nr:two-component sensor histidine kinase [Treponema sp.]